MDSIRNWLLICDVNIHVTISVILIQLLTIGPSFPFPAKLASYSWPFISLSCKICSRFSQGTMPGMYKLIFSFFFTFS